MPKLMNLSFEKTKDEIKVFLDGKPIEGVASYTMGSSDIYGIVELSIKLMANFPVERDSITDLALNKKVEPPMSITVTSSCCNVEEVIDRLRKYLEEQILKVATSESRQFVSEDNSELFARIPLQKIKFVDSYEQSKFDRLIANDPQDAINQFEAILAETGVIVSM